MNFVKLIDEVAVLLQCNYICTQSSKTRRKSLSQSLVTDKSRDFLCDYIFMIQTFLLVWIIGFLRQKWHTNKQKITLPRANGSMKASGLPSKSSCEKQKFHCIGKRFDMLNFNAAKNSSMLEALQGIGSD